MSTKKLIVKGVQLDPSDDLPIQISFDVADVRYPKDRGSASSLSVIILGTPEAHQVFNFIYEVNAVLNTFNPNKKVSAVYAVDEIEVFRGSLQLIEIVKQQIGQLTQVQYRCYLLGTAADLFTTLRTKQLTDLDFSSLNHPYTDVAGNFQPILGQGYCYPYIDYGLTKKVVNGEENNYPASDEWTFTNLKPAIFEKAYIDKIFADAGFTYQSNFFNSTYYKSIIIPANQAGHLKSTSVDPLLNEFLVNRISQQIGALKVCELNGDRWEGYQAYNPIYEPVPFNNEASDPGNLFSLTTNIATIQNAGVYSFSATFNFNFEIITKAQINQIRNGDAGFGMNFYMDIMMSLNGGTTYNSIVQGEAVIDLTRDGASPFLYAGNTISASSPLTNVPAGALLFVKFSQGFTTTFYTQTNGSPNNTGQVPQVRANIQVATQFKNQVGSFDLKYGETVQMNLTIPQGISQLDFLKGIIIDENLYIEQDPNNEKNYFIEPRNEFLNSLPFLNWTAKLDASQPISISPAGNLNITKYIFRHKQDSDYANVLMEQLYKVRIGQFDLNVDNDFSNKVEIIESIFSATAGIGNTVNDLVVPGFYTRDVNTSIVQPISVNIRRLYWGGRKTCEPYKWNNGNGGTVPALTEYSYAGSVNDPYAPTVDLGFGVPKQLFYFFNGIYTTNNRYNIQYSEMIAEMINPQSKLIKMYLVLTAADIFAFTFRKLVFIVDSYYYVNKIVNFNPLSTEPTLVELLWLKSDSFNPQL